jgi:hypothetical protein
MHPKSINSNVINYNFLWELYVMTEKDSLQKSTESHRFHLAMLFIGGFLAIMIIALVGEFFAMYSGLKDLAATFSGWITAVIGFYFLQQNTERAQEQAKDAIKEVSDAGRKTAKLTSVNESNVQELRETMVKQEKLIKDLLSDLKKAWGMSKSE